jgi:DNA-binding transcriptional regulator GbsR (MarR family)
VETPEPEPLENKAQLTQLQQQVVEFFVDGVRVLGLPRSLGEIYGILFITDRPLSLDDLVSSLGISKGSASQGLRTLRTLGAVREVNSETERRTYYEPAVDLKRLVGGFIREQIVPHLTSGKSKLEAISESIEQESDSAEKKFYLERTKRIESWLKRGKQVLPVIQKILGQ